MRSITWRLRALTVFFAAIGLSLGSCSYFDVSQSENGNMSRSGEVIDLTTGQTLRAPQANISEIPAVSSSSQVYKFSAINPIPRPASNASVEVYSLDEPAHSYSYVKKSPSVQPPVKNNQFVPFQSQPVETDSAPIQLIPPEPDESGR